mmetsp:Transcript_4416/g.14626  ORF Transcript_4416/g.14626 Transcript_4416/m.14626 type:complete len:648 (+) Transcript_4416:3517-5460(+)
MMSSTTRRASSSSHVALRRATVFSRSAIKSGAGSVEFDTSNFKGSVKISTQAARRDSVLPSPTFSARSDRKAFLRQQFPTVCAVRSRNCADSVAKPLWYKYAARSPSRFFFLLLRRPSLSSSFMMVIKLRDEAADFGDDGDLDALALADAAHPIGRLRKIAPGRVLADREDREADGRLLDVHAGRVGLVVEGEALRARDPGAVEGHDGVPVAGSAEDDHLHVVGIEEADRFELFRGEAVQQVPSDLLVVEARDERSGVDEGVAVGGFRSDEVQELCRGPVGFQVQGRDDGGVRQSRQNRRVVAVGELRLAEFHRQEVVRRPGEPQPRLEEQGPPQGLARRRQLQVAVHEALRERVLVQVAEDRPRSVLEEPVQAVHLRRVPDVERLQGPHLLPLVFLVLVPRRVPFEGDRRRRRRCHVLLLLFFQQRRRRRSSRSAPRKGGRVAIVGVIIVCRAAADLAAGALDEGFVLVGGRSLGGRSVLLGEVVSETGQEGFAGGPLEALVAVGEDREADGDVGVGELARVGRLVLAGEGDRQVAPPLGLSWAKLVRGEGPEGDAVHLGKDPRQKGSDPVLCEVQVLELLVGQGAEIASSSFCRQDVVPRLGAGDAVQGAVLRLEVLGHEDLGEVRLEALVVEGPIEKDEVRHLL